CPKAGWTPASSIPAGSRCCRRPNSTSQEDENALRHSPAHLGADGYRGGLLALGRGTVGERTGEESTTLGLPTRPCPCPPFLGAAPPRREDEGRHPGNSRLSPHPADSLARGRRGRARTRPLPRLRSRYGRHRRPVPRPRKPAVRPPRRD